MGEHLTDPASYTSDQRGDPTSSSTMIPLVRACSKQWKQVKNHWCGVKRTRLVSTCVWLHGINEGSLSAPFLCAARPENLNNTDSLQNAPDPQHFYSLRNAFQAPTHENDTEI